jgi:hypothetical protein
MGPIFLIPGLHNFIGSAGKLKLLEHAYMASYPWSVNVTLGQLVSSWELDVTG